MRIRFDLKSKRMLASTMLAALCLGVCAAFFSVKAGATFAVLFLLVGCVQIETNVHWGRTTLAVIAGFFYAALAAFNASFLIGIGGFLNLGVEKVLWNVLCILVLFLLLFVLTADFHGMYRLGICLTTLLSLGNCIVYEFRGKELHAIDFLSASTALNVVQQYKPEITVTIVYGVMLAMWSLCSVSVLPKVSLKKRAHARGIAAVLCAAVVLLLAKGTADIPVKMWDAEGSYLNGYFLNFSLGVRDSFVKEPEGYSFEEIQKYEKAYGGSTESARKPNILIIMDESYADFRVFGAELQTNQAVTPFIDSLRENVIKGYALTSIFGGTTANAEFEVLTGMSMGFLPNGSVPYQQYLRGDTYSLAWYLKAQGYDLFATHPYFANGWSRPTVYPYLGFEDMTFVEDYPQENLVREFVSDQEMFGYVLERLHEKREKPLFLFGVTMQNHGGYEYVGDNYEASIALEGYDQMYPQAEQYLSLLHETDQAVKYLIDELSEYPEETIVLFFGDHFPKTEQAFFEELYGGKLDTLDAQMLQYTVPFFIWANYDIEEAEISCSSLNYLSNYLLEAAGVEMAPLSEFLRAAEEAIPAMNAMGYYSKEQGHFVPYETAAGKEAEWLRMYSYLQYNHLFDKASWSDIFWREYAKN